MTDYGDIVRGLNRQSIPGIFERSTVLPNPEDVDPVFHGYHDDDTILKGVYEKAVDVSEWDDALFAHVWHVDGEFVLPGPGDADPQALHIGFVSGSDGEVAVPFERRGGHAPYVYDFQARIFGWCMELREKLREERLGRQRYVIRQGYGVRGLHRAVRMG